MQRQLVSSSTIRSIGYDGSSSTLELEFHHGGIYQYYGVPESVYRELMAADSKGSYLAEGIKGRYRFRRVGKAAAAK